MTASNHQKPLDNPSGNMHFSFKTGDSIMFNMVDSS